eukprot:TRINITY_DN36839_c0_g1_i2.p1 TRINITY_DN36839_c0_g1~~TRINITY_DN36839_c0_g1_i2.p1  ORF type:complete len:965 (+),score=172.66 TRINITY_DN36839_c0_g1_i2:385-2895(+)
MADPAALSSLVGTSPKRSPMTSAMSPVTGQVPNGRPLTADASPFEPGRLMGAVKAALTKAPLMPGVPGLSSDTQFSAPSFAPSSSAGDSASGLNPQDQPAEKSGSDDELGDVLQSAVANFLAGDNVDALASDSEKSCDGDKQADGDGQASGSSRSTAASLALGTSSMGSASSPPFTPSFVAAAARVAAAVASTAPPAQGPPGLAVAQPLKRAPNLSVVATLKEHPAARANGVTWPAPSRQGPPLSTPASLPEPSSPLDVQPVHMRLCLARGEELMTSLGRIPLPPEVNSNNSPLFFKLVDEILRKMYSEGVLPSEENLQQQLRARKVCEAITAAALPLCARKPDRWAMWVSPNGHAGLIKRSEPPPFSVEQEVSRLTCVGHYGDEFLEVLAELVNRKIADTPMCVGIAPKPRGQVDEFQGFANDVQRVWNASAAPRSPSSPTMPARAPAGAALTKPQAATSAASAEAHASPKPAQKVAKYVDIASTTAAAADTGSSYDHSSAGGVPTADDDAEADDESCDLDSLSSVSPSKPPNSVGADGGDASTGDASRGASGSGNPNGGRNRQRRESNPHASSLLMLATQLQNRGVSTLMLRNLPHSLTQKRLIEELSNSGFSGLFDFCYMPSMFGTGNSKGYAFVNLTSPEALANFVVSWHGSRRFGISASDPPLNVSEASLQGRIQNARKWDGPRMKRVRNPALRPLVIETVAPPVAPRPPVEKATESHAETPPKRRGPTHAQELLTKEEAAQVAATALAAAHARRTFSAAAANNAAANAVVIAAAAAATAAMAGWDSVDYQTESEPAATVSVADDGLAATVPAVVSTGELEAIQETDSEGC